ncbi:MAG: methyltransferase [Candidatus Lernaella stagnicola]|nr:methyltransferase [Candidatus Lernaella stagnicola]
MEPMTDIQELQILARGFQRSRVFLTAMELDLFSALGDEPRTATELAERVGADARAVDRLANVLVVLGLLEKRGDEFANTELAAERLVRGKPGYIANLAHINDMWKTWSTLTEAVRAGHSVIDRGIGDGWATERRESFIAAMHHRGREQAPVVADLLDLSGVERVLDVGGGSACFSAEFARQRAGLTATVFDLPTIVPITQRYIDEQGMSERIDICAGDYNVDPFPGGYDLVFLSAIAHIENDEGNAALIAKAADALRPGGQVVVVDYVMDESRLAPPPGAIFALNMLVATVRGDTFTESEMRRWFTAAGLTDVQRIDTPFLSVMIVGRKV